VSRVIVRVSVARQMSLVMSARSSRVACRLGARSRRARRFFSYAVSLYTEDDVMACQLSAAGTLHDVTRRPSQPPAVLRVLRSPIK